MHSPTDTTADSTAGAADRTPTTATDVTVHVRYFASARAAAGTESETVTVPAPATLEDVVAAMDARHGPDLTKVLAAVSFLLDGTAVRSRSHAVSDGCVLDVLPPFAGG